MIYMISKEQAKAAVEHINGSKYSLATATEVELENLLGIARYGIDDTGKRIVPEWIF